MNAIRFDGLDYGWQAGRSLLQIPEFSLAQHERVLLQGPSGSGKSTLLGLIGGVLEARSGEVEVLGQRMGALRRRQRDRFRGDHIGFIFQMFNLVPYLSPVENVLLTGMFSRRRRAAAQAAGTQEVEARRLLAALGLDDPRLLAAPASQLSQGQQQRVAAARALFGRPELLVADEPTSSLDVQARERFLDLLMHECEISGAALLFVSHDPALAGRFDRRVSMADINRAAAAASD